MTRVDLPVLTHLWYQAFFNQLVFDIARLLRVFGRTLAEAFKVLNQAYVAFHVDFAQLRLSSQNEGVVHCDLALGTSCRESNWQLWNRPAVRHNFLSLR
jgi:hypothetical protein